MSQGSGTIRGMDERAQARSEPSAPHDRRAAGQAERDMPQHSYRRARDWGSLKLDGQGTTTLTVAGAYLKTERFPHSPGCRCLDQRADISCQPCERCIQSHLSQAWRRVGTCLPGPRDVAASESGSNSDSPRSPRRLDCWRFALVAVTGSGCSLLPPYSGLSP